MRKTTKRQIKAKSASSSAEQSKTRKTRQQGNRIANVRSGTKQSAAIEMLRSPSGTSIAAVTKATGWQSHSVRGFLAGVVKKRLKLKLESAVVGGVRIYRITGGPALQSPRN
jgi:Protein of unknown function (DUF3489)